MKTGNLKWAKEPDSKATHEKLSEEPPLLQGTCRQVALITILGDKSGQKAQSSTEPLSQHLIRTFDFVVEATFHLATLGHVLGVGINSQQLFWQSEITLIWLSGLQSRSWRIPSYKKVTGWNHTQQLSFAVKQLGQNSKPSFPGNWSDILQIFNRFPPGLYPAHFMQSRMPWKCGWQRKESTLSMTTKYGRTKRKLAIASTSDLPARSWRPSGSDALLHGGQGLDMVQTTRVAHGTNLTQFFSATSPTNIMSSCGKGPKKGTGMLSRMSSAQKQTGTPKDLA